MNTRYEYAINDHLGNTRITYRCLEMENATAINQAYPAVVTNDFKYDPWGLNIETLFITNYYSTFGSFNSPNPQRHRYNGKEQISSSRFYDYGARQYDPVIGRWLRVDPLAEKWNMVSPFSFVINNPIKFIDPDGKDIIFWMYSKKGNEYTARQVSYDKLGKTEKFLVQQLAMNKDGAKFLNNYVNGKLNLGAATLNGNSKKNINIVFSAGADVIYSDGSLAHQFGGTSTIINDELTIDVDVANQTEEAASITLGHEVFLHALDYGKKNDKNAHEDHKGWDNGSSENGKKFNKYLNYLKGWYGTKEFDKAEKENRKSNHENVIKGL